MGLPRRFCSRWDLGFVVARLAEMVFFLPLYIYVQCIPE